MKDELQGDNKVFPVQFMDVNGIRISTELSVDKQSKNVVNFREIDTNDAMRCLQASDIENAHEEEKLGLRFRQQYGMNMHEYCLMLMINADPMLPSVYAPQEYIPSIHRKWIQWQSFGLFRHTLDWRTQLNGITVGCDITSGQYGLVPLVRKDLMQMDFRGVSQFSVMSGSKVEGVAPIDLRNMEQVFQLRVKFPNVMYNKVYYCTFTEGTLNISDIGPFIKGPLFQGPNHQYYCFMDWNAERLEEYKYRKECKFLDFSQVKAPMSTLYYVNSCCYIYHDNVVFFRYDDRDDYIIGSNTHFIKKMHTPIPCREYCYSLIRISEHLYIPYSGIVKVSKYFNQEKYAGTALVDKYFRSLPSTENARVIAKDSPLDARYMYPQITYSNICAIQEEYENLYTGKCRRDATRHGKSMALSIEDVLTGKNIFAINKMFLLARKYCLYVDVLALIDYCNEYCVIAADKLWMPHFDLQEWSNLFGDAFAIRQRRKLI